MRLVRTNAQAVEHQHFQIAQTFNRRRRNLTEIGRVRKIIEAIRNHRQPSVNYFEWSDFQISREAKRRAVDDGVRNNLRQSAAEMRRLKHVLKNASDVFPGAFVRIQSQRAMTKVQRANVVEPEDVIRMTVRYQHRVEMFEPMPQSLLTK